MCVSATSEEIAAIADRIIAVTNRSDDPAELLAEGEALWLLRDHTAAIACFDRAIAADPPLGHERLGYAYYRRSICLHQTGRHAEAEADATTALSLRFTAHTLAVRAIARFLQGNDTGAIADADAALAIDPDEWEAQAYRGKARLRLGDHGGAIADVTGVIDGGQCHKYASQLLLARAEARLAVGEASEAVVDVSEAIRQDAHEQSHFPYIVRSRAAKAYRAYVLRSRARLTAGDVPEALADAFFAVGLAPGDPDVYRQRAAVYQAAGRHDVAVVDLTRAALLASGTVEALAADPADSTPHPVGI